MGYRIEARQKTGQSVNDEVYQVVDGAGAEYCRNAGGAIEDTPSFSGAVERYNELTGESRDPADGFDDLVIDGIVQTSW